MELNSKRLGILSGYGLLASTSTNVLQCGVLCHSFSITEH